MKPYDQVIESLSRLPRATVAEPGEVLVLIRQHALMGSGTGYIDAHLVAAAKLTPDGRLWTRNKRLARVATALGVGYEPQAPHILGYTGPSPP